MKNVLCYITAEETDEYSIIQQNIATFHTLLKIKAEQGTATETIKNDIARLIQSSNMQLISWWEKMTSKYNIPYHADRTLHVNTYEKYICLD